MNSLQVTIYITTLFLFLVGAFVFVPLPYVVIFGGLVVLAVLVGALVAARKGPRPH